MPPDAGPPGAASPRWLEGMVVLDFTRYLAGPACTRLLVELGAEVIKVERPPYGDPSRSHRPRNNHRSGMHIQQNRGKRSLAIDIDHAEGADLVRQLVSHVDVVVENFSPGVMGRKGLAYEDLRALNPRLVMASISGYGQEGSLSARPCFDLIAQGFTGLMHMTGETDGPPTFSGVSIADNNAAVHAFAAIGHALFHRERTGEGAHLDIALVDALFHFQEQAVHSVSMDPNFADIRQGRFHSSLAPAGSFRGPAGWITLLCTQGQIDSLWNAMGRPDLATDERFATNPSRFAHREELAALIEDWMATFATDDEVLSVLAEARVPAGPVLSPRQTLVHPHFVGRGLVRTVDDPVAGPITIPGFPFRVTGPPADRDLFTPALGEHNREILSDLLGLDESRIRALEADGVLGSKPH